VQRYSQILLKHPLNRDEHICILNFSYERHIKKQQWVTALMQSPIAIEKLLSIKSVTYL
jgi:hypothetical protein